MALPVQFEGTRLDQPPPPRRLRRTASAPQEFCRCDICKHVRRNARLEAAFAAGPIRPGTWEWNALMRKFL